RSDNGIVQLNQGLCACFEGSQKYGPRDFYDIIMTPTASKPLTRVPKGHSFRRDPTCATSKRFKTLLKMGSEGFRRPVNAPIDALCVLRAFSRRRGRTIRDPQTRYNVVQVVQSVDSHHRLRPVRVQPCRSLCRKAHNCGKGTEACHYHVPGRSNALSKTRN